MLTRLLPLLLLAGCATEVSTLIGPRLSEGDTEVALTFQLLHPVGEKGICGWTHSSVIANGEPFNDRPEIVTDQIGCGWRWGGR